MKPSLFSVRVAKLAHGWNVTNAVKGQSWCATGRYRGMAHNNILGNIPNDLLPCASLAELTKE